MTSGRVPKALMLAFGVLAILVGALWMGQGLNLIPGSFMTGDSKWFIIGAVLALAGVLLIVLSRRRGGPGRA